MKYESVVAPSITLRKGYHKYHTMLEEPTFLNLFFLPLATLMPQKDMPFRDSARRRALIKAWLKYGSTE